MNNTQPAHQDRLFLFITSCISLCVTSMIFIIRGDIAGPLTETYHLSNEQLGLIWGPAFWGFTIAIFICGALVDYLGLKRMHALSSIGFIVGVLMVIFAPAPDMADGEIVSGIFATTGTSMLFLGFLLMGLSQGVVEGVINPLAVTLYSEKKAYMLNVLHAFWPAGFVIGGLLAYGLSKLGVAWQIKLGIIIIPSIVYLVMCLKKTYPNTERVAANISTGDMFKACLHPLFFLLIACMFLTAAVELGPDQWFPKVMGSLTGVDEGGVLFLVYTAGLMFILRFFFGVVVHHYSPFLVLAICSALTFAGLYWLGSLEAGTGAITAFAAATIFGIGKTFFWPTMLGIVSERFPKGGALAINVMGGAGMLSIAVVLPVMGGKLDSLGAGAALQSVSYLAIALVVIFSTLYFSFRAKGGYKAEAISS